MAHWAKPGVKCVCIDNDGLEAVLVVWRVYTIRSVFLHTANIGKYAGRVVPAIRLVECDNPRSWTCGFAAERFRPCVIRTQKDDVALFAPILTAREREST